MTTRNYSSRSQQTTLTSAVTAGAATMVVVSGTALMGGVTIPAGTTFTIVVDPDTAIEEIVDATAVSTNTFTITRAIDGSSAQAHSAGAVVRHMAIGRDYREANAHVEASTGVHGISNSSSVVGTIDTQTLTNKTLTSPTITNPSISGAGVDASIVFEGATADAYETTLTVTDPTQDNTITMPNTTGTVVIATAVQTLTNKTLTSPTISGSPVITGLSSAGMTTSSATPKDYVDSILGSATAAATSAASAATSAASAATSAGSSETSAIASAASAATSASSATAAATSATSAAASATAAATSATSAAASATAAATSATSAAASATTAANSVATIAGYATASANSATAAATSATSAAASSTAASTSATSAASSASAAATSASSAATSATSAATSATSAAASAASAAAVLTGAFDAKGDLLVGTGTNTFDQLTVAATNGYVLSVNSATATGLEWAAANPGDITGVTAGTGLTGGGTSGAVTVSLDTSSVYVVPTQTGQSGKYLKTDGTTSSWSTVDSLPSQTGNAGEFLTTDGTTASWAAVAGSLAQPTEPTSPPDGQIWIDTDGTAPTTVVTRWSKAPTAGTTTLTGTDDGTTVLAYTPGYEEVFLNGVLLSRTNDYTASTGTSVVLSVATVAGDIVEVICPLQVAYTDAITTTAANAAYVPKTLTTTKGDIITATAANTPARLGVGSDAQILVADSTAATGLKWATPASGMTNPMTTTGDTIYSSSGSTPARLGIGSSGQVLTVSGGVPTWATASAAAQTFTLISTTSLSGSTTTVSGLSGKNQYYFYINGASMTGAGQDVLLRFNSDSGSNYTYLYLNANGSTFNGIEDSGTAAQITLGQQGSSATDTLSAYVMLQGGNSTAIKPIYFTSFTTGTSKRSYMGDGRYLGTSTISSVSIIAGSGTFDAGSILVYGA